MLSRKIDISIKMSDNAIKHVFDPAHYNHILNINLQADYYLLGSDLEDSILVWSLRDIGVHIYLIE